MTLLVSFKAPRRLVLLNWLRVAAMCPLFVGGAISSAHAQSTTVNHNIVLDNNVAITAAVGLPPGGTVYLNAVSGSSFFWTCNGLRLSETGSRLPVSQPGTYALVTCVSQAGQECESSPTVLVVNSPVASGHLLSYTKTTTVVQAGVTTASGISQLPLGNYQQQTAYADGMGRPIESVQAHGAPNGQDLVTFQAYDAAGNAPLTFLPYVRTTALGTSACQAPSTLRDEQTQFYTATARVTSDAQPYGTASTEASPLARTTEAQRPGTVNTGHPRRVSYQVNEAADKVHRWAGLQGSALYVAGELGKLVTTDEDGRVIVIFQDQLGRVVLKRSINQGAAQNFDTYTVYDELGRSCYVVPPGAVDKLAAVGQWNITDNAFIKRWLYTYTYDNRGRLAARQFPGAQPVYFVYDVFDRLVLTQDGNQRATSKWGFIKFDILNRPVTSGLYTAPGLTAAALQSQADAGNYGAYEERTGTGDYSLNQSFPALSTTGTNTTLLTQTYYDDYDLNGDSQADYSYVNQGLGTDEPAATSTVRGLMTVQKTRIVRGSGAYGDWLVTALFYDEYNNLVQKRSNNHLNLDPSLPDVTTLVYRDHGFVPQLQQSIKTQLVATGQGVTVRNRFAYDHAGRAVSTWQQNERNGIAEPEVLVVQHTYNALGQLVEKNLHSADAGTSFLQSVDFAYDINGQLASINNSTLLNQGNAYDDDNDVFGLELVRAQSVSGLGNTPRYDGGLSAVRWKVNNTQQQNQPQRERSYRFTYDGLGRLTNANYVAASSPGVWGVENSAYSENGISYDSNGNILTLKRYTQDSNTTTPRLLDRLLYSYGSDEGNQLQSVRDLGNTTQGFRDQGTASIEYPVDANGNVTRDDNKGVDFTYNALNKVERQQTAPGRAITYDYDASGTVLHRAVSGVPQGAGTVTKTYDYVDGFAYEGLVSGALALASVPTPEGRALALQAPSSGQNFLIYEYHLRDHQGNLRVAFRAAPTQVQLHLTMEPGANEEGSYPRFSNVATTRSGDQAKEQAYSAAVIKFQAGPRVRVPSAEGDQVKIDFFYRTPSGVQASYRPTGGAVAKLAPLAMTLAPVLLPAPRTVQEGPKGQSTPWLLGVQFSLTGLLTRHTTRQASGIQVLADPPAIVGDPPPTLTAPAYLAWRILNDAGDILSSGQVVLPVTTASTRSWDHATATLPVDLRQSATRTGYLEVELLNDGSQPVYYDSVTFRHRRPALVISQENHYYPFGMNMQGVAVNTMPAEQVSKAQYNGGSELQDELLDAGGVYSTPFRTYDPALGRFQGVDPLADTYASQTPYQFANNDPVNFNDPTGAFGNDGLGHSIFIGGGQESFGSAHGIYTRPDLDPLSGNAHIRAYFPSENGLGLGLSAISQATENWMSNHFKEAFQRYREANENAQTVIAAFNEAFAYWENSRPTTFDSKSDIPDRKVFFVGFTPNSSYFFPMDRENEAYAIMLYLDKRDKVEISAYLTIKNKTQTKGVLILPWAGNDRGSSQTHVGSYLKSDKRTIITEFGNQHTALGYIHTHNNYITPSNADLKFNEYLGLPSYTMTPYEYYLIVGRVRPNSPTGYTFDLTKASGNTSLLK